MNVMQCIFIEMKAYGSNESALDFDGKQHSGHRRAALIMLGCRDYLKIE